jgi:hypothetical protein
MRRERDEACAAFDDYKIVVATREQAQACLVEVIAPSSNSSGSRLSPRAGYIDTGARYMIPRCWRSHCSDAQSATGPRAQYRYRVRKIIDVKFRRTDADREPAALTWVLFATRLLR